MLVRASQLDFYSSNSQQKLSEGSRSRLFILDLSRNQKSTMNITGDIGRKTSFNRAKTHGGGSW